MHEKKTIHMYIIYLVEKKKMFSFSYYKIYKHLFLLTLIGIHT